MACAIEDAGFEIRDSLMWIYGTGFPKSQNVSAFLDKMAGAERPVIGENPNHRAASGVEYEGVHAGGNTGAANITAPTSPAAVEFDGFGTALKPAFEPIVLARKPLSESTVAANVLRWRTGALNIDGCRVGTEDSLARPYGGANEVYGKYNMERGTVTGAGLTGRWPANLIHDGSDEVVGMFPATKDGVAGKRNAKNGDVMKTGLGATDEEWGGYGTPGVASSAARFFYSAKASKQDRNGSKHPTVKPVSLMEWLAVLITPPGGTVLDPFAGSGTTGIAASRKGFQVILCERENEYVQDICNRFVPPCPVALPAIPPCPVPLPA